MITTKKELKEYLDADALLYPKLSRNIFSKLKNIVVTNPQNSQHKIYSYLKCLRHAEYHANNVKYHKRISLESIFHTILMIGYYYRLRKLSYQTGIQIAPNSFGKGLQIWHYGYIVVNADARIGDYATIYPGVVIGAKPNGIPTIGSHVFIGAGSKILGGIRIGDNVTIAPNAVVTKDVPDNVIVGGVPAKIIKWKND